MNFICGTLLIVLLVGYVYSSDKCDVLKCPTNCDLAAAPEKSNKNECKKCVCKSDPCKDNANNCPASSVCKSIKEDSCRSNSCQYKAYCEQNDLSCSQPKLTGPCRGNIQRYYYNSQNKACEEFTYGGCSGNYNNFETKEKCVSKCIKKNKDEHSHGNDKSSEKKAGAKCKLPKEVGLCKAAFKRFFYNTTAKSCQQFIYGGCGGNENNFISLDECLVACNHKEEKPDDKKQKIPDVCNLDKEIGPGRALIQRFYFDKVNKSCKSFNYGGFAGNGNNFETLKDCMSLCGKNEDKQDACNLDKEIGPGRALIQRFYYDKVSKSCKTFNYGGFAGNQNNFEKLKDCLALCGKKEEKENEKKKNQDKVGKKDVCNLPLAPKKGEITCMAYIPRYYYDTETKTCKDFVYGGCGGNQNNFLNKEDCLAMCVENKTKN